MNKEKLIKDVLSSDAFILSTLVGGMMNESSIVSSNGKKYVLYVSTEQANEMVNRDLEKDNQSLVYSLGITSKNVYFDTEKGIKINEFIKGSSLDKISDYDLEKVAKLLHVLHGSNKLSQEDYQPFKRFIVYENDANSFIKEQDKDYLELRKIIFDNKSYLESQKMVLCHNDAQKSNIVKSDKNEYFLIDFEFMGNNDPIYDIATFGNGTVEEGYALLNEYAPNPSIDLKKRYYLWRIFISLQWYNVALVKHYRGEGKIHNFNFLSVAEFFLNNAKTAKNYLSKM